MGRRILQVLYWAADCCALTGRRKEQREVLRTQASFFSRLPWMATEPREQLGTDEERKGRSLGEAEEVLVRLTAEPIELQRLHTGDRRSKLELEKTEGARFEVGGR